MMRRLAFLTLTVFAFVPASADPDLADLVARLGNDDWKTREDATFALIDAGEAALPALRDASGSTDAEVRMRAREAIEVIESGLGSKGYRKFGNLLQTWGDLDRNQRSEMFMRLSQGLEPAERGRVFAKLAIAEEDAGTREMLIDGALQADGARAMAIFGEKIGKLDPKKDAAFVVKVADWYNANGQPAKALELLDKLSGPISLPKDLDRRVANIYAANRNWRRAADAFGGLAERAPQVDEAEAAGERIAYLKLAGEEKEFAAALDFAARAAPDTRDAAFGLALERLSREGAAQGALAVIERGAAAGSAGTFAVKAGHLLMSQGRDGDALLMFRRALKGVEVDAVLEAFIDEIRNACASAGEQAIATREFALELKDPSKSAAAHASAARALAEAGYAGAAAVEWRRAAALCPGSPVAAAEAARALAAAGDPRAGRWATMARALGGPGSTEEALLAAPMTGRPARVVARRAVAAGFQGSPAFHATAGDIAATTDPSQREVVAFGPAGRVLWRWRWAEPPKMIQGRFPRTRTWEFCDLLALPDAFLLVIREEDSVQHEFNNTSDWAGAWLALIDAETGTTRSLARAEGQVCDPTRASLAHAGRLFVATDALSAVVATDIATARTAWVRPLYRASAQTDPSRVEVLPRLAARDGLLFVPSPHGSRVVALRMTDGTTAWEAETPGPAVDVALDGEALWACAGDSIVKLEAATGRVLLTAKLGATVIGAPARLGDVVAARTKDGWLRGLSAADGTAKWKVFVGAAARLETLLATDGAFFLCRRDNRDVLPSWVVTPGGRPLRRLYLRFTFPPETWRGLLLVDDLFGRRQAFCLPAGGDDFSPLFPSGLILVDGAAMAADDAGAIAGLADGKPPEVAGALATAALAIDPENPDALAIRVRLAPPHDKIDPADANAVRADAWRALDAFPPLDPRRTEALASIETVLNYKLPLLVRFDSGAGPWVDELRLFNALARLAKAPGDREAMAAVADMGLRGAADFLPAAALDPAAAVARLRCGDASALPKVIEELHLPAGTARMEAAEALAWRDEKEAVDALRQHLGEGEPVRIRLSAALAVGASDAAAFEVLEKFGLPSDDDAVFLRSASVLLAAGRPKALDALANPENYRRSAGSWDSPFEMLAASDKPEARARLEALITPQGVTTTLAARALMQRDRPRAMKVMAATLQKCEPRADNERWLLQLLSPSEIPEVGPLFAERAKAMLPSEEDISWPALHHMIAESLDTCGKGAEARKFLETYGSILPDTAETNNNTAWFLSIARSPGMLDGKAAVPRALRAVAAEPWNASYLDTLAEAYRADGNWKEACAAAERALALSSTDRDAMGAPYYERQVARMKALRDSNGASDGR